MSRNDWYWLTVLVIMWVTALVLLTYCQGGGP